MTPSRIAAEGRQRRRDPGGADEVPDHRLRRADRDLVGVGAVGRLDRPRLGHVVERRRRSRGRRCSRSRRARRPSCGGRWSWPGPGRGPSAPGR